MFFSVLTWANMGGSFEEGGGGGGEEEEEEGNSIDKETVSTNEALREKSN